MNAPDACLHRVWPGGPPCDLAPGHPGQHHGGWGSTARRLVSELERTHTDRPPVSAPELDTAAIRGYPGCPACWDTVVELCDALDAARATVGLTQAEHDAMALTAQLVAKVCQEVIGQGRTRDQDVGEFVGHVHAVQQMILAQAAARAHPELYRLLGDHL